MTATFEELREGDGYPDGNKRCSGLATGASGASKFRKGSGRCGSDFTLENYRQVLGGKDFEYSASRRNCRDHPRRRFLGGAV